MTLADLAGELGGRTTKLTGIRKAAARHMVRAWEAPAFDVTVSVDMSALLADKEQGTTVTDALVVAVARTLIVHPGINAWYSEDGVTEFCRAHVGIAVATDAGLVVPVIRDADSLGLARVADARRDLVGKARERTLGMDDVTGGTFTLSNLGMLGADRFTAIVNAPQVAILAIGATTDRFVRSGDGGEWRPMADFTISCDHRAVDGAGAANFLAALRTALEYR